MTAAPERLTSVELAESYYVALSGMSRRAADRVQMLWQELDQRDLTASWEALVGPKIVETVTAGQAAAAALADPYLSAAVAADGGDPAAGARIRPGAFAGYAADGRALDSLLYLPVITSKQAIAAGASEVEAMMRGLNQLLRMAASEVTDAGRSATGAGIAGRRTIQGYIRIATSPCCARCAILSGKEFGWNRGFQRHPRCFPAGVVVSGPRVSAASRRWYEGELVILSTASGEKLPLTGNHPVLTRRGWIPANLLQEGDEVVRSTRPEGATPLIVPDHHNVPSLIEDVWGAFSVHGLDRMPTTAEDFHGDGQQGEVDVVYADRSLGSCRVASLGQQSAQFGFASGLGLASKFLFERTSMLLDLWGSTHAGRTVGGSGLGLPLVGAHLLGPDDAGFASSSAFHSSFPEPSGDHVSGYAVLLAEGELAGAVEVGGGDLVNGKLQRLPRWDAPGSAFTVETREGYASRGRDLLDRLSGQVELDRVVELRRIEWSGHVYSLTSVEGWHIANNLIVSNCDCIHMPATLIARGRGGRGKVPGLPPNAVTDARSYFNSLSQREQERIFTIAGARAIRDGADITSVVNSRRGMYTADAYRRRVAATREGATRRGAFFRSERRRTEDRTGIRFARDRIEARRGLPQFQLRTPRLLPEEIYKLAETRDEAIAMLRRFGYIS